MVSDSRILVVTVGKSLFSSASWQSEGPFDFRSYRRWCEALDEKGKLLWLRNPDLRAKDDDTCQKIYRILTDSGRNDSAALARLVTVGDSDEPRRYSAELTTLLVMYRETEHGAKSFEDFLGSYGAVELIGPTDENDEACVAARHLEQILLAHGARHASGSLLKKILRSDSSRQRIRQWGEYLGSLDVDNVDLVVTGGYKGFALLAGDAWARGGSKRGWRVIYLHQDNQTDLFVHQRDREGDKVEARAIGERAETVYRVRAASSTLGGDV